MASWSFLAALSWLIVATIGLAVSLISLLTLVAIQFAVAVAIGGALMPFLFARNILSQSATAGMFAALYGFGLAAYSLTELGPTTALLVLLWLGFASAMAAREASKSPLLNRN